MTRIDNLSRIQQLLLARSAEQNRTTKSESSGSTPQTRRRAGESASLNSVLMERIQGIGADEEGIRKATSIIVESTLVWQFGQRFIEHPDTSSIISDVKTQLLESEDYRALIVDLLKEN